MISPNEPDTTHHARVRASPDGMVHFPLPHLNVLEYSDYRQFLRDMYRSGKTVNRKLSFRYFSQRAGINSSGFYKEVIEGHRKLNPETIPKTATAFDLDEAEAEYFETLVLFNQARSLKEKNLYFDKLIETRKQGSLRRIEPDRYAYFSIWYHSVVRELAVNPRLGGDPARIADAIRPRIKAEQAEASLQLLLDLGFLKRDRGRYVQCDPLVTTGYEITSPMVKAFQSQMLERAMGAFNVSGNEPRLMSSNVVALSAADHPRFVKVLRAMKLQLLSLVDEEKDPEVIYALNLNFFPISEKVEARP